MLFVILCDGLLLLWAMCEYVVNVITQEINIFPGITTGNLTPTSVLLSTFP